MADLRMTVSEFRQYVDEAFLNGTKAALDMVANVIAELKAKADAASPSDVELLNPPEQRT